MSIRVQRALTNLVHGPYGRWVMLGLLIVILFVFAVMDQVQGSLSSAIDDSKQEIDREDVAGSFSLLPGAVTEVDHATFQAARVRLRLAQSFFFHAPPDRVSELDVWTHLLLLEAAEKEGVRVSAEDLREFIGRVVPDYIAKDQTQYRKWVMDTYRVTAPELEDALREFITAFRVRQIYQDSFLVAPAATRQAAIDQAAQQNIEYALGDYAALDASRFLGEAADELKSEANPEGKLREFFDKDPSVTLEADKFRNPKRYRIEILYTIHGNIDTDEKLARIQGLVQKAFPEAKLPEPSIHDRRTYYGTYRDRLLEMAGETLASVTSKVQQQQSGGTQPPEPPPAPPPPPDKPKEEDPKPADPGAPDKPPEEEKKDPKPPDPLPAPPPALVAQYGYDIVKAQVAREVAVRVVYEFLYRQTRDDVSFKELYEKLRAHDDPAQPVCATEPGKGLIVYRDFDGKALSGDELQEIEDSGVKFGFSFKPRVTGVGETDLPKRAQKPDTLGDAGHGRQLLRVLEVIREQRKAFDELSPGEVEDLRNLFYLPERARTRAREKLEALRQRFVSGELQVDKFRAEAEALGCRVHEGEWFEASYDSVREPDATLLWPGEFLHMRDRYFLRKSLAQSLDRDRAKPEGKEELKPPCFLPVDTNVRRDAAEPGAAYLIHLRERKRPDATTVSGADLSRYLRTFANQRLHEEQERWTRNPEALVKDFRMRFVGEMQAAVDEDVKRRAEDRAGGRPR